MQVQPNIKKKKMNAIPEEFQIKTLLNQDTYLVNGKMEGQTSATLLNEYEPTILGHPFKEKRSRLGV
jgi:glyceraldehyde-3-phosphate dehydrogenase (NADP+)